MLDAKALLSLRVAATFTTISAPRTSRTTTVSTSCLADGNTNWCSGICPDLYSDDCAVRRSDISSYSVA